jgi:hypothetical protein
MQRVEMAGIAAKNFNIEPLGLVELTVFVGAPGPSEFWRHARWRLRHSLARSAKRVSPPRAARTFLTTGKQAW